MKLSQDGIKLLEQLEGKRNKSYLDSAGLATIGIGHLVRPNEPQYLTATLTDQQIYDLLNADLVRVENSVNTHVMGDLEQHQFDALVILTFNIGTGAFESSTVLERINKKDTQENITEAWKRFKIAGGQVSQGLMNRREKEVDLYFNGGKKKCSSESGSTSSRPPCSHYAGTGFSDS
ncbi:MAG: lysozyme [Flavobacteriales bacterium]|nr:lysozyme [Flavobacteriales bacterium]